jgi:shikimate dehydrogenase
MIGLGDLLVALAREINCLDLRTRSAGSARDVMALDAVLAVDADSMLRDVPSIACIGAGGSATALLLALGVYVETTLASGVARLAGARRPHLTIVGRTQESVDAIDRVHPRVGIPAEAVSLVRARRAGAVGEIVRTPAAGSFVINATGLGKTTPGSPLPGPWAFPDSAVAWASTTAGR